MNTTFDPVAFRAASEAAERWLDTVALVAHWASCTNHPRRVDFAYKLLMPVEHWPHAFNLAGSYDAHSAALLASFEPLMADRDEPIRWPAGRVGGPCCWSSAHEAALGITHLVLDALVEPLRFDAGLGAELRAELHGPPEPEPHRQRRLAAWLLDAHAPGLTIPAEEYATLGERIRVERARLLRAAAVPAATTPAITTTTPPVWLGGTQFHVAGKTIVVDGNPAAVLGALVELGGAATKPDLAKKSGVPTDPGTELKKVVKNFPDLGQHITFPGGKSRGGYRTAIRDGRRS